ncbi:hypothetical protein [Mycobacterium heckeshornense]|uniref:hypothetical protein n=1 Tax=Mycobacterium heckeshornense TaxID=110505 RepID=UPI000662744E|nr:hypothetical protein [Mycobacterium heckeshornense]
MSTKIRCVCILHRTVLVAAVLLSSALLTAGWDPPSAAADDGTPVVVNCGGQPEIKPESIILMCGDGTWAVDKIVWASWSAGAGAKGTGIEYRRSCVPTCAQGSATYSPVTITLTGATPPDFRYTNAVVTNQNTGRSDTSSLSLG